MSKKILVTGGAGFIGSHLCDALLNEYIVICLDNFNDYYSPEQKRKNISHNLGKPNYFLEEADITDFDNLKRIFKQHKIDAIIHLAARAGVRPSLDDPFIYERTNILGTLNLLELSRINKVKTFVFGSSSSVYGDTDEAPFRVEQATDRPISPYAATKKAGEVLCHTYSHLYGIRITCLRFFTVYGPRGRPDMAPYLFTKAVLEGRPLIMYGEGNSRRDYTYVSDVVSGIVSALKKSYAYEIFNLGNSKTVELKHLISVIEQKTGKTAKIIKKEMQPGDVALTYADIEKSTQMLGYLPKVSIEEGIQKFVEWYK